MTANYPENRTFTEPPIDDEEDRVPRAALVGMREGNCGSSRPSGASGRSLVGIVGSVETYLTMTYASTPKRCR